MKKLVLFNSKKRNLPQSEQNAGTPVRLPEPHCLKMGWGRTRRRKGDLGITFLPLFILYQYVKTNI